MNVELVAQKTRMIIIEKPIAYGTVVGAEYFPPFAFIRVDSRVDPKF